MSGRARRCRRGLRPAWAWPQAALIAAAVVAGGVAGTLAGLVLPARVAAHTELVQASPGAGQRAGGTLEFIDLAFAEPVSDAVIEVEHEGELIDGSMLVTDGSIVRFQFDEPLSREGRYDVRYQMLSFDLDETESGYFFTYAPDAPEAFRLGTVPETGRNWVQIIATGVLVICAAGLAFLFLGRIEANRRAAASPADDEHEDR